MLAITDVYPAPHHLLRIVLLNNKATHYHDTLVNIKTNNQEFWSNQEIFPLPSLISEKLILQNLNFGENGGWQNVPSSIISCCFREDLSSVESSTCFWESLQAPLTSRLQVAFGWVFHALLLVYLFPVALF